MSTISKYLTDNAIVTRRDLVDDGFGRHEIDRLVRTGDLVKVRHGVFSRRDADLHGFFDLALACKLTGGVIWGPTAGRFHGLTDDIPYGIHVMTHPSVMPTQSRFAGLDIELRRTRTDENLSLGVTRLSQDGLHVDITDRARTVVDLYRLGEVRQHAVEAVRSYVAEDSSIENLRTLAESFGVEGEIMAMVDGIIAAFERSPMRP